METGNTTDESSDGAGTISEAYERVILGKTRIEIHQAQNYQHVVGAPGPSIKVDAESTLTASSDDQSTPAQKEKQSSENVNMQWEDVEESYWDGTFPEPTNKREKQDSTEDEAEIIKVSTGSFVNSDFNRDPVRKRKKHME